MPIVISGAATMIAVKASRYVAMVRDASYVRCMRWTILSSSIPVLYISLDLSVLHADAGAAAVSVPMVNLAVTGITNEKVLLIFLVLNGYYSIQFSFAVLKVHILFNPPGLFCKIFLHKAGHGEQHIPPTLEELDFYGELRSSATSGKASVRKAPIPPEELAKQEGVENPYEVGGFVLLRPLFGFVEHYFCKMLLPLLFSFFSVYTIVREIWH